MASDRWLYALSLSAVASSISGLLVPLYLVQLGGGPGALGISAALASLLGAPGAVLAGRYADRTGNRRGVVVTALAAAALALLVLPLLRTVPAVVAVNAVLAFALAAVSPVVTMLVVDDAPETAWNARIARLNALQGYGSTVGFVVGAVWTLGVAALVDAGVVQGSLFALAAGFGVAAAALATRSLPRAADLDVGPRRAGRVTAIIARTSRNTQDAVFSFGTNRVFWATRAVSLAGLRRAAVDLPTPLQAYFLASACFFTGFAVFWAPLPLYLQSDAGFTSGGVFALYLVNNVASTVLFGRAGRISDARDVRLVQGGALGVRAGAFVGIAGVGLLGLGAVGGPLGGLAPLVLVVGLLCVVGATWAFITVTSTAVVSRFAPPAARGGVLGTYAALSAVAGAVGGLLGGWLAATSFSLAFAVAAALVVLGGIAVAAAPGLSLTAPAASQTRADD